MRLNASKFGLLAGLLVQGVAGQTTTSDSSTEPTTTVSPHAFIKFGDNLNSSAVFKQTDGDVTITWTAPVENLLIVKELKLHRREQTSGDDSVIGQNLDVPSLTDNGKRSAPGIYSNAGLLERRSDSGILPPEGGGAFNLQVTPESMSEYSTILAIKSNAAEFDEVWNDKVLYMEVVSQNETSVARSYSSEFIVANSADPALIATAQGILRSQAQPADTIEANGEETSAPTSTADPTSDPTSSSDAGGAGEADDGSSSASGRALAPGAIAGIVVGVVVGALAVAGVLVWFFCLRRRQRQRQRSSAGFARAHEGPYGAGSGAVMMTEKEAAAGIGAAESRDRSIHGGGAAAADAGSGSGSGSGAAYAAPYNHNDYAAPPGVAVTTTGADSQASLPLNPSNYYYGGSRGGHSRDQSRSTAAATASPIESRYAHLVEEGMTEDEIRRLEEEERQLDAAIEEAGSGGGGGGTGQSHSDNNNNSDGNNDDRNNNNDNRQQMSPTSPTSLTVTTPPTSPTTRGHGH
ncbi:hypothetical protein SLS62_004356 [Diatrype stigma]|uniref:Mid2 domain-containing protein n=1 Tax=Diatrype stigma TaxID=117547 RepID=A0AAN9UUX2_9PEZI